MSRKLLILSIITKNGESVTTENKYYSNLKLMVEMNFEELPVSLSSLQKWDFKKEDWTHSDHYHDIRISVSTMWEPKDFS